MENIYRFNSKADIYSKFRPDYPDQLIADMITEYGLNENSFIADIGSGTGIMTKKLLDFHLNVIAIEPNPEMREMAENQLHHYQHFTSLNGTAENTTLQTSSIEFITVAQAFHWFDIESFKKECRRILKPFGKVAIVSNSRITEAGIIQDIISIYKKFCPDFLGFSNGIDHSPEVYNEFFFNKSYTTRCYNHPLSYDKPSFIGRHLSASYAPKKNDKSYPLFIKDLSNLFEQYSKDGFVTLPNVTICRCGLVDAY